MTDEAIRCKGCGAEILWVKSEKGKMIPIDKKVKLVFYKEVGRFIQGHESHFATCPKADSFRKKPVDSKP
jgi:hypothetical protein